MGNFYSQNFATARGSGCDQRISDAMALVRTCWRMIFSLVYLISLVHSDIYINKGFPLMFDSNISVGLFDLEPGTSQSVEEILENACTFRNYAFVPDGVSAKQTNNEVDFMRMVLVGCQW